MGIKISVIIPVYNAEPYLMQCLDSILGQDICDIELICVDDCSSDQSLAILDGYAARDERVRVMRGRQKLYAGGCRNAGLEAARGEYCLFLDADDWLAEGSLRRVYEEASRAHADILRCRALDYNNQTGGLSCSRHNGLKRVPFFLFGRVVQVKRIYPLFTKVNAAPWGGLFRRELLMEHHIRFNRLLCVNDRSFFWESILNARGFLFSRETLVYYRTNLPSSLVGGRVRNFACHFASYNLIEELCAGLPPRMRRCILDGEMFDLANWLEQSGEYTVRNREMVRQFMQQMDRSPWNGKIERARWYRRFAKQGLP